MKDGFSIYKYTEDEWSSNYTGNLVKINVGKTFDIVDRIKIEIWIITIHGTDDIIMSKTFSLDQEKEMYECFMSLIKMKSIAFDDLNNRGFD
jgi:hypothetical protein